MSHTRKNIRSTKIKPSKKDASLKSLNNIVKNVVTKVSKTNEAHVLSDTPVNYIPTKQESFHVLLEVVINI